MGTRGELLAKVEELAPRLPVEHATWNSRSAMRWFEAENPNSTQEGGTVEIE
jgi:hypothetical protein